MKLTALFKFLVTVVLVYTPAAIADGKYSGFLEDYSGLTPDADRPGALIYRKPGVDLGKYGKIALTPVEIWYSPESEYRGISPDNLKLISDSFRALLVRHLEPDYPVVDSGGPDVLGVRIAVADVKTRKKGRTILNFTPAGFALYTLKDIAGANVILDDATVEVELIDSVSGERLGALVDQQKATAGKASWDNLEAALTFYAQRFRTRLDAARKK